jgi:hypothetical protein
MLAFEGDSRVVWFEGNPLLERHGAERNVDRDGGVVLDQDHSMPQREGTSVGEPAREMREELVLIGFLATETVRSVRSTSTVRRGSPQR